MLLLVVNDLKCYVVIGRKWVEGADMCVGSDGGGGCCSGATALDDFTSKNIEFNDFHSMLLQDLVCWLAFLFYTKYGAPV